MAVTPLPESNTKRYFSTYVVASQEHTMQCRCDSSVTDAAAIIELSNFWNNLASIMGTNVSVNGLEVAALGSDVRNPVTGWTNVPGAGGGVIAQEQWPRFMRIQNRSTGGHKGSLTLFGMFVSFTSTYKIEPIVGAELIAMRTQLNTSAGFWLSIDGTKPTWYNRLTQKTNDHWVDDLRN